LLLDDNYRGFLDLVAGQVATAIANARDYEEERRRAESLAELDRAKTTFFSNVSHEFRTPLTLMLGPVEELLSRSHTDLAPAAKGQLEVVNRNGLRLLRLVNTMLDFSRIEAGRVQAVFDSTDLGTFTAELASVFRAATERAGLNLKVDCSKLPEPVYVDREMWEKIVLNLVSNAFKFTFEGEIEVKLRADSSNAVLTVRDTGVGIPAEEMPRLFERFHRVQNIRSRTHEGSGIGLSLVLELVKIHGGSIRAESKLGAGTTFFITVPLGNKHLPPDHLGGARNLASTALGAAPFVEEALRWLPKPAPAEERMQPVLYNEVMSIPSPSGEMQYVTGRPLIIIADDNADMRHYLAQLLSERYNVQTVPDGQVALTAARERHPDLVLSDVMMPILDGFGLVRELRADTELKTIPIILLSARAGEESRVEGLQQGADDYLIKPFSARELIARVGAHLEMARTRREAAEQIRQSEERLRVTYEHAPVGICEIDLEGRFINVNPRFCDITGYSREELLHKKFQDITYPDDLQADEDKYLRPQAEKLPFHTMEKRYIHKDGHTVWILLTRAVVRDDQGRPSFEIKIIQDISERKRAEEELRESEERFRALFENIQDTVILTDPSDEGRILSANKAACRMFGYPEEEFLQLNRKAMFSSDEIHLEEALKTREGEGQTFSTLAYKRKDGSTFFGELISAQFNDKDRKKRAVSTIRDITERQKAEDELRRYAEQLTAANKELESFSYSVSHDLRAPVRTMISFSNILMEDFADKLDKEVIDYLVRIKKSGEKMNELIDDMLSLSKITRQDMDYRDVDVSALANSILNEFKETNPDRTISISISADLHVRADEKLLKLALQNLLRNAWKFTCKVQEPRIEFGSFEKDGQQVYYIKDNGAGFDMKHAAKLFEPFKRLHSESEFSGTGIGLAIVDRVFRRHGGKVWAEGEPGMGATFFFTLGNKGDDQI
jgi:PAS domain S-box-containing protein